MSSHNIKKPNGGVTMRRVMEEPNPNENLLERVLSRENVQKAWKRVKANKGAPGIDNMSTDDFLEFAHTQWDSIRDLLLAGTYQPSPVKRVEIPKPTGGTRPLGIPTVLDRAIQQAVYQVMMPIFDPDFSEFSYGFRPGRSAHDAVRKVREYIRHEYRIAVDMDLSKFFDRVNHDVLMHRVWPGKSVTSEFFASSESTCAPGSWLKAVCSKPVRVCRRVGLYLRYWPTSFWMTWIKSWRNAVTSLSATPTTLSYWFEASGQGCGLKKTLHAFYNVNLSSRSTRIKAGFHQRITSTSSASHSREPKSDGQTRPFANLSDGLNA